MHRMPGLPSALATCTECGPSVRAGIGDPEVRLRVALFQIKIHIHEPAD